MEEKQALERVPPVDHVLPQNEDFFHPAVQWSDPTAKEEWVQQDSSRDWH